MRADIETPTLAPHRVLAAAREHIGRLHRSRIVEFRRHPIGGHPVDPDHGPHLCEAIDWLVRAQDATPDDGFSRGYSITWNRYFRSQGWQPSYPETTGYIIPTFLEAARHLGRPELAERAVRAARWETAIQLESGAVQGGVIGQGRTPAVFNTGQVIFGWLAAHEHTGEAGFAESARRAAGYLVSMLDPDGLWRSENSRFARSDSTLYNARVAWALAEAGCRLGETAFTAAAIRNLRAVVRLQRDNGWFPACCLNDPERPLLHTIAYTVRGLLEGGRVLGDERFIRAAARAAAALAERVSSDGWLPGRFRADWSGAAAWSCLTGEAQIANCWMRLHLVTGERQWLEPVPRVLAFLKSTQNRTTGDPGLRGGIKGSAPVDGEYGRYEVLNWATKFFADALMRHEQLARGTAREGMGGHSLA
ncbi:MAG TPA: hypothetical protein VNK43_02450 [Gemmatimonadales bacterium]|nr:hypothetical protein [Gemmatimonadales bacterium]